MTDLPLGADPPRHDLPAPDLPAPVRRGRAVERRRSAELTPAEKAVRRRNRRWMLFIGVPAIVIGFIALGASILADYSLPSTSPSRVPIGYKAVSDGPFGYAVPKSWTTNTLFSDDVGDLDTSGSTGWVAEHDAIRSTAPVAGETPPSVLAAFGEDKPTAYHIGSAQTTAVPGATVAFRYQITRPGGFNATAIDAWQSNSGDEIWLLIDASPATTRTILSTFRG